MDCNSGVCLFLFIGWRKLGLLERQKADNTSFFMFWNYSYLDYNSYHNNSNTNNNRFISVYKLSYIIVDSNLSSDGFDSASVWLNMLAMPFCELVFQLAVSFVINIDIVLGKQI